MVYDIMAALPSIGCQFGLIGVDWAFALGLGFSLSV